MKTSINFVFLESNTNGSKISGLLKNFYDFEKERNLLKKFKTKSKKSKSTDCKIVWMRGNFPFLISE